MSHSVHPYVYRIGILRGWKSRWFGDKRYARTLKEDTLIREWLIKKLKQYMVQGIDIERSRGKINVIIKTSRPGLLIGRGGEGIEKLNRETRAQFSSLLNSREQKEPVFKLSVEEVRDAQVDAATVVGMVIQDLEKRLPFRRVMKQTIDKVMFTNKAKGVRVMLKGRLDGSDMGRKEWLKRGQVPLQTLRADIDFALGRAQLPYGTIGVKVWIYKGEVFLEGPEEKGKKSA